MKELLLGPPLATSRLVRERLRKLVALPVFSSDAISSTAYGTEQIMLILVAAGAVATRLAFPIALAIGGLLTILILSYRQTITAYPSAGGAGRNLFMALGRLPGVTVTVVHCPARPAATRPPVRHAGPSWHDFPASGNAHRHPALRS
jgi:hypothetical protein